MTTSPLQKSDRQVQMQRAFDYYNGNPRPQLRITARGPNDNLPLPTARVVVDKGASFLFGRDVQSQITDGESDGPQKWLDEAWRRNKRAIILQKLALNGGIFGNAFIRLLDVKPYPRVIVLDPQTIEVTTDPDDIDTVFQYVITQPEQEYDNDEDGQVDEHVRKRTVIENENAVPEYEDTAPEWVIYNQEYRSTGEDTGAWVTLNQQTWPYPFSPVLGCQNLPKPNDYWGESDIPEDVLSLIDGINRVASHYNKIIRLHAHPKVWTRGMGSQKLDLSADSITHLPSETAELRALEMMSDLTSTMALLNKLISLLAYAVRIPLIAMGEPDGAGSPSGVSLQIRFQPLLEKTESKRMLYGDLLCEVDRSLLCMGGFGDSTLTQLVWPEILPKDPLQEREVAILDDQLGLVSKETLSEQFGFDFDHEQKLRAAEAQTAVDAMPMPVVPGQRPDGTIPDHPAVQQGKQGLNSVFGTLMQSKMSTPAKAAAAKAVPNGAK
jgi:hypothetical protein